jgi:tagatose-1,6-bisphosphate aldolase
VKTASLGKWRRLQQASGDRGTFTVLAIDHRGPLRRALSRLGPATDLEAALAELKEDIVRELAPHASAVLLDPELGLPHCLHQSALPGNVGLLVALDTGSTGDPANVSTGLVPDWTAARAVRIGAAGAKLLVYYHPEGDGASRVETLVQEIAGACTREDLPLYLEPLTFSPDAPSFPLKSEARRKAVIETARRLVPLGVDILKSEFPLDVVEQPDEQAWADACQELTEASAVPWVLLSGGVSWDLFLRQAEVACRAGASGVMAGRAFWDGAVTRDREARTKFLTGEAGDRLRTLRGICDATGQPLQRLLQPATFRV